MDWANTIAWPDEKHFSFRIGAVYIGDLTAYMQDNGYQSRQINA